LRCPAGHFAVALCRRDRRAFADDFLLVTQNIAGLHLRAGNSGPAGYWVVGPRAARPTTRAEFEADAGATWAFHLHLRQVFAAA
jgi:hypothetical protein